MSNDSSGSQWGPPGETPPPPPPAPPVVGPPSLPPTSASTPVTSPPYVGDASATVVVPPDFAFDADASTPQRAKRSAVAVGGAVAGVLALGVAGVFAVSQIRSGDDGGAASPEEVGTAMMASLEQEDVLGMMDLLLPGERETFREPMIDIVQELSRLEILSEDASLSGLAGLDLVLEGETTDVSNTNVSDIANITMRATMSAVLDGEQLPVGDFVRDLAGADLDLASMSSEESGIDFELPMTVVEHDGRWYLSVFHTLAEQIREDLGEPIPDEGVAVRGGASPEGAIDVLLDGVEALDLAAIVGAINPQEAQALQRYAPLFIGEAQEQLDEVPLEWRVTETAYEVSGSGDRRFVDVVALRIDGDLDGEQFSVALADGCVVIEAAGERIDTCEFADDTQTVDDALSEVLPDAEATVALFEEIEAAFADYEQPGISVQQVDGEWFVSPIGAGFDQLLAVFGALDRAELDRIVERGEAAAAEFEDLFSDLLFGGGDDLFFEDDPFFEDVDDDTFFDDDTFDETFDQEQTIADGCYALGAVEAVAECLRDAIAAGSLPDYYLGVELEYPECGLGGLVTGELSVFELTDAEYTDLVATASSCFGELIASGAVEEFQVSPEYLRPECGEGRNPWAFGAEDEQEFFDRWLDCVYD